jgi:DNA helicase IV
MSSKQQQLASEQKYFDEVAAHREKLVREAGGATAADKVTAAAMAKHVSAYRESLGDGEVAFGRFDNDGGECLYIGRRLIPGPDREPMVIGWQAPAAAPYYRASHGDRLGVVWKRVFDCTGNRIDDFSDVVFHSDVTGLDDALLRELSRGRSGRMRDIVRTIQAAQYDIIRAPMKQTLVIEGGPGTGKTALALHRISWLLFEHENKLSEKDVLVIGPNPTFTRYIETVVAGLGNTVTQWDLGKLAPVVPRGRTESAEAARFKGDARLAGVLRRALDSRIGSAQPAERLQVMSGVVTLPGADVDAAIADRREAAGPYAVRRDGLKESLLAMVEQRGGSGARAAIDLLVQRLWPVMTPQLLLRDLFNSRDRLLAARGDISEDEIMRLWRRAADRLSEETWTRDDLPLLDEAEQLITGSTSKWGHIMVDEVQDLSPMQLRSIARRSLDGSLTLVGDLAQSTGPWARDSWQEITEQLPFTLPVRVASLRYGYRVPAQVQQHVEPLLAVAAPMVRSPEVVRRGPADPRIHRADADEVGSRVVSVAREHQAEQRFVGIVCPASQRAAVEKALSANGLQWSSADRGELGLAINLVSPQEAKGLEFDAVIVVEPEDIVAADPRGHRMLYIAMTRTTGYLDVVCAKAALPLDTATANSALPRHRAPQPAESALAHQIASMIKNNTDDNGRQAILREVRRLLDL